MLKYGLLAKGIEWMCFKPALEALQGEYPDMDMDERNYRNEGGQLHRTKTLANGDACCNFHVTKI